jgi:DNA-binding transcriptional LysR family regulator
MNIRDIEAFVAVAEAGSINRAALRLNLTQPATTRRVQNFEAAIGGVTLLDRRVKPPVLTPAGRQVLERCRAALKAIAELKASVSSGVPAGELRIGVAYGLGEVILSSPFDDLQRRFPEVHLRISSNWTVRLIDEVRTGALDCAIGLVVEGHQLPAGVRAVALGDEDIAVVTVRESGRRKLPGRVRLSDLAGRAWVLNPRGCICRGALERAMDRAGLPMQVGAEVFGEELQLSYLVRSGGLGLVPRRMLANSPHRRRLKALDVADFHFRAAISVLHGPSLGRLDAAVAYLQDRVSARLAYYK